MVDPSPPHSLHSDTALSGEKARLRRQYRQARSEHFESLPKGLLALMLNRPPAPVVQMIAPDAVVGLYFPSGAEAPALGWARWLAENGRTIALPWFAGRDAAMTFRRWENPFDDGLLSPGPWRAPQPGIAQPELVPDVVIVPLVAFTREGHRLGQGGGHYDRWLAGKPDTLAIGLAWDCQLADELPIEAHDRPLYAVVTPTRIYQGDA